MPPFTVCVFCSSSERVDRRHQEVAERLGRGIAEAGWALVYGGARSGLMGRVARAALAGGAHVTGVLPDRLIMAELALEGLSELVETSSMRERKARMDDVADAFCVLPGGVGTLEELVEVLTLKALGYHRRPIVVVDADGFWDPLLTQLSSMVAGGFAHPDVLDLFVMVPDVDAALAALAEPAPDRAPPPLVVQALESSPEPPGLAGPRRP